MLSKFCLWLGAALFSLNIHAETVVVLGDSISAAYGIEVEQGWVRLLESKLRKAGIEALVRNESISGETSAGGLARIDRILGEEKPSVVIIELGANDGLRGLSPAALKHNLDEIIRRSRARGAKVLLLSMTIPPNYGKRYIDMIYNVYHELSREKSVPLVPFILGDIALVEELMQPDGLHPNAKAQPLIADKIWQHLLPLLNTSPEKRD
ncbi:arylesterase [Candidatus Methylomicrobium oryzae]|jgi:acyl-CoA thioesterase-1|uniref:arylesterase n=1 Tax=Candidatus Methylomicrobium oryzae TaxID=2802053 RepID=UPI001922A475|nr:arylesterase [Methylomicrobium sp. RS1]MBL1264774.1 arylesterase [Methylomicrobium sp. RS1]